MVYLDFQKAFDKVPHERLKINLKSYGIGPQIISWISDFLSDRMQRTVINGFSSEWCPVTSGIPQGSVLGPILFVCYSNNLPDNITTNAEIFADDTKLFANTLNKCNGMRNSISIITNIPD